MFDLVIGPTETRVPALGSEPRLALSSTVEAARGAEALVPYRAGNLTMLVSAPAATGLTDDVLEAIDRHFLDHELATLKRRPTSASVVACATALLATKRAEEAVRVLSDGRARFAGDYWIEHHYGVALSEAGRVPEALDIFSALREARPNDWRPVHALGRLQMMAERWVTAEGTLDEATKLPDASALVFNDLGSARLGVREVRGAIRAFRRALTLDSRCALAHNNLGVCYLLQGSPRRTERALQSFLAALECDFACAPALHNAAESYIASEQFGNAVGLLEPHVKANPLDAQAVERLAWAHHKLGSAARAVVLLREGASRSVEAKDALLNNLGVMLRARGDIAEASRSFQRAIEANSERVDLRMNFALLLHHDCKWAAIVDVLPERLVWDQPHAAVLRASALTFEGHPEQSEALLRRSLTANPGNEALIAGLGYVLCSHLHSAEKAIEVMRGVGEQLAAHPMIVNNLAYALIKAGRFEEARRTLSPTFQALSGERTPTAICIRATWGLLRMREGFFEEGMAFYREAQVAANGVSTLLIERLSQKMLVEDGRELLRRGQRDAGTRKLQRAMNMLSDAEFTNEARALLRAEQKPN